MIFKVSSADVDDLKTWVEGYHTYETQTILSDEVSTSVSFYDSIEP